MKVAALGIDCSDPRRTWELLRGLPPVDLLVLPELAFTPWLCATRQVSPAAWATAAAGQDLAGLADLRARVVVGTLARADDSGRFNDAFWWSADTGVQVVHSKTYLPDETGFWEASWYRRGPVDFPVVDTPVGRLGITVCTEMWFTQHAFPDADVVVVPRATPIETTQKWLAGGAVHAVTSGAFCVSSNRAEAVAGTVMGGAGWLIDPDGEELGVTTVVEPVVVRDLDLAAAAAAKRTYPRYVQR